MKHIVCRDF